MLGVILSTTPRLSETFISHELEALASRGVPLRIFALTATQAPRDSEVVTVFAGAVESPPIGRGHRWLMFARAHLRLFAGAPRRYSRLLGRKVMRRTWFRARAARARGEAMAWSHVHDFVLAGWLAEQARRAGIRHLHAHYASGPTAVALLVHELTGMPMSFTAHAKDAYAASRHRLKRKIDAATFVATCSHAVRDYLLATAPERSDAIHLIHHGISPHVTAARTASDAMRSDGLPLQQLAQPAEAGGKRTPPLLLAAGRLVEKKGFDDFVDALAILRQQGVDFRAEIVGEGRLRGSLQERAGSLNGALRLTGALPHRELIRRYGEAACFVMPSRVLANGNRDGIPNVLLEAMAVGVPVVATRVGGIPEVVADGVTGSLVEEGDVPGLAARMADVLAAPAAAAERAALGRERVQAEFDLERNVDRLVGLLQRSGALSPPHSPSSLRIGYLVKRYPRLSETFILNEILAQERQGAEIHIVSLKKPDEGRFHADLARVRAGVTYLPGYILPSLGVIARANGRRLFRSPNRYVRALGLALRGGDRHPLTAFLKASVLADVAERKRLDVLHAHFATGATFMAMLAAELTGRPYGFTAHARDIYGEHIDRSALRRKVDRASYVVVVSEESREFLRQVVGSVLVRKAVRIYNGVTPELLRRPVRRFGGGSPLLLGVGRLVPKKGFTHLITAAAELSRRGVDYRLAIAGEGPLRTSLEREAEARGVRVRFLGPLTHGAVLAAMQSARVVALPAVVAPDGDRDVLPTVLLEAQALGRPVVSTRLTGIPEIVVDGETGFLVPADGPLRLVDGLVAALESLLSDPQLAARMGAAGRRHMAERFQIASGAAMLAEHMREACRGGTAVRALARMT